MKTKDNKQMHTWLLVITTWFHSFFAAGIYTAILIAVLYLLPIIFLPTYQMELPSVLESAIFGAVYLAILWFTSRGTFRSFTKVYEVGDLKKLLKYTLVLQIVLTLGWEAVNLIWYPGQEELSMMLLRYAVALISFGVFFVAGKKALKHAA